MKPIVTGLMIQIKYKYVNDSIWYHDVLQCYCTWLHFHQRLQTVGWIYELPSYFICSKKV